jgi:hypothetical protein
LRGRELFSTSFNPGVSIAGTHNLVREMLHIFLGVLIIKTTTNKTLGGVKSVLGVLDSLKEVNVNIKHACI